MFILADALEGAATATATVAARAVRFVICSNMVVSFSLSSGVHA
jgi:hypothetical protein